MTCVLNCVKISFAMPGKEFLLQFSNISNFIGSSFSACLPTNIMVQQIADTETDNEAAMLAEFEADFS
jgi:hypothetical protein